MMKKTLLMLAALVLALTSGANDAYPPEIAKWTEADLAAQRTRTVKLMRDFQTAVKAGAGKFVIPPGDYRFDRTAHPELFPAGCPGSGNRCFRRDLLGGRPPPD